MDLYNKKDRSIPQKTVLIILEILILIISYWILFEGGYNIIFSPSIPAKGNNIRHIIIFIFNLIVFLRICLTVFYLVERHIPWEETFSIPVAFAIYYVGYALLGYGSTEGINVVDIFAILLFLFGSYLNTWSELSRKKWKTNPENKGRLYTVGLFKYSMHINYFGDILWVTAYAIITRNWYSIIIPVFIFCFFAFYNVPKLDKYLSGKYGEQFEEYRRHSKKLLPFIY